MARKRISNSWTYEKSPAEKEAEIPDEVRFPALTYLQSIYRNTNAEMWRRVKAAIAALPYEERRYRSAGEDMLLVDFAEYDEDTAAREKELIRKGAIKDPKFYRDEEGPTK